MSKSEAHRAKRGKPESPYVNVRIPRELFARVGRVAPSLRSKTEYAATGLSKAAVLRIVIVKGLEALESSK